MAMDGSSGRGGLSGAPPPPLASRRGLPSHIPSLLPHGLGQGVERPSVSGIALGSLSPLRALLPRAFAHPHLGGAQVAPSSLAPHVVNVGGRAIDPLAPHVVNVGGRAIDFLAPHVENVRGRAIDHPCGTSGGARSALPNVMAPHVENVRGRAIAPPWDVGGGARGALLNMVAPHVENVGGRAASTSLNVGGGARGALLNVVAPNVPSVLPLHGEIMEGDIVEEGGPFWITFG